MTLAKSWRSRFIGYQWEQIREGYFLKYGRSDVAETCRRLAQGYRRGMDEDNINF
tara:strand:- start:2930 stop:3094 length:165 start_codon:yes stop_codon:yes gene_type:complete